MPLSERARRCGKVDFLDRGPGENERLVGWLVGSVELTPSGNTFKREFTRTHDNGHASQDASRPLVLVLRVKGKFCKQKCSPGVENHLRISKRRFRMSRELELVLVLLS